MALRSHGERRGGWGGGWVGGCLISASAVPHCAGTLWKNILHDAILDTEGPGDREIPVYLIITTIPLTGA